MSKPDLYQRLDSAREIELTVRGRKSGNDLSRPVWFVREDNILYLLSQSMTLTQTGTRTC
jgi:hypothetical protein